MTDRITIEYAPNEGATLRLLGLIERRGFRITAISMAEAAGGRHATLSLDLSARGGARALDTLGLQLRRLSDVQWVGAAPRPQLGRHLGEAA